jgi:hypothetical protein
LTSVRPWNVSDKIADYATPEEIEAMVAALRVRLQESEATEDTREDVKRKAIKRKAIKRKAIKCALRMIRKGKVPFGWDARYGATDILAPVLKRFDAAFKRAMAAERNMKARH